MPTPKHDWITCLTYRGGKARLNKPFAFVSHKLQRNVHDRPLPADERVWTDVAQDVNCRLCAPRRPVYVSTFARRFVPADADHNVTSYGTHVETGRGTYPIFGFTELADWPLSSLLGYRQRRYS